MAWYWVPILLFVGFCLGWLVCTMLSINMDPEISLEKIRLWISDLPLSGKEEVLYPLVKEAFFGRRTIHRCPIRKGKNTNLLDPPKEEKDA